jgi:hypothetical protein
LQHLLSRCSIQLRFPRIVGRSQSETYSYFDSLLRVGVAQHLHKWDWQLELAQPSVVGLPSDAISPITAQGQLGLGATYYASNGYNTNAAAAFLKQGFLQYHFDDRKNVRLGRFEYIEGRKTEPKDTAIAWLQANRVAHRLIGNFGFSTAQRSVDGVDGHYGSGTWASLPWQGAPIRASSK